LHLTKRRKASLLTSAPSRKLQGNINQMSNQIQSAAAASQALRNIRNKTTIKGNNQFSKVKN